MRAVLDTTILVSAIRSRYGASKAVVDLVLEQRLTLLMDYRIACEYREVMLRPAHVAASHLHFEQIVALLDELEGLAEEIEIDFRHRPLSSDPEDDRILDVAINGSADAIVTSNLRHFVKPAADFGIDVVDAKTILFRIRQRGDYGSSR